MKFSRKKLVFQYENGLFYKWMGENSLVDYEPTTASMFEADDFSSLLYPEKDAFPILYGAKGRLRWVDMTCELSDLYK